MDVQTFCFLVAVFSIGFLLGVTVVQRKGVNMDDKLVEAFANLAHEQWSGWMKYMFSKGPRRFDGTWVMSHSLRTRWERQMNTPYEELSEKEKESDRVEAKRMIEVFREWEG